MLINIRAAEVLKGALRVASTARQFMEQAAADLRANNNDNDIAVAIDDIAKACQRLRDLVERRAAERLKDSKDLN